MKTFQIVVIAIVVLAALGVAARLNLYGQLFSQNSGAFVPYRPVDFCFIVPGYNYLQGTINSTGFSIYNGSDFILKPNSTGTIRYAVSVANSLELNNPNTTFGTSVTLLSSPAVTNTGVSFSVSAVSGASNTFIYTVTAHASKSAPEGTYFMLLPPGCGSFTGLLTIGSSPYHGQVSPNQSNKTINSTNSSATPILYFQGNCTTNPYGTCVITQPGNESYFRLGISTTANVPPGNVTVTIKNPGSSAVQYQHIFRIFNASNGWGSSNVVQLNYNHTVMQFTINATLYTTMTSNVPTYNAILNTTSYSNVTYTNSTGAFVPFTITATSIPRCAGCG